MIDPDINEHDALADLIGSDGWRLYLAHIDAEWGPVAYARQIDAAIAEGKKNRLTGDEIAETVSEIAVAARKVQVAAQWPIRRLAELKAQQAKKIGGGGGILAAMRRA
jgi:hypothetical protein